MIKIKNGIDLPLTGAPSETIDPSKTVRTAAVLGNDYVGMKPTMAVQEGDRVRRGSLLFTDKKTEGVRYASPAAGTIKAINRGTKRALLSVVVEIDGDESERFEPIAVSAMASVDRTRIVDALVGSGLWVAFRTRPFSRVPPVDQVPRSIFVTAMDTNPLAADPVRVIARSGAAFAAGLDCLARLTEGRVFVCTAPGADVPKGTNDRVVVESFVGPHPAGLAGTHIHHLDPVVAGRTVWSIGYQDVIAIGASLPAGELVNKRTVALGGSGVVEPRLIETILGASIDDLTAGELAAGEQRVISGSVLSGHVARGAEAYLGRYHTQISVIPEDRERRMFGYLSPGTDQHSVFPIYLSSLFKPKAMRFTTTTNGSTRGMVPIGTYERVIGIDTLATQLLRALLVGDIDTAIKLGCLELDEEDLALCTYACPAKYEYGPVLRQMLTSIEKEG